MYIYFLLDKHVIHAIHVIHVRATLIKMPVNPDKCVLLMIYWIPKLCTKPPVTPLPSKCGTNTDNCSGTNTCALELIIGDGTNMTISYM